ncbi:MAG: hypothetical protein HZA00_08365, partial [Nitrospinae bacterium]|nr:hypothetical protein [Nitrospinota bacterium]
MKGQKKIVLLLFFMTSWLLFIPSITMGEDVGNIIVAKGVLTTEKCLK